MKLKQLYFSFYIVSLIAAITLGAIGYWAIYKVNNSLETIVLASNAQRASQDADMMHDALRADVLAIAFAAENADSSALKIASENIQAHSKKYLDDMSLVTKFDITDELKEEIKNIRPKVEAYILTANEIAGFANGNQVKLTNSKADVSPVQKNKLIIAKTSNKSAIAEVKNRVPQFLTLFSELEVSMGKLSNHAQAFSMLTKSATNRISIFSKNAILGGTLLSIIALMLLGRFVTKQRTKILGNEPELVRDIANTIANRDLSQSIAVKAGDSTSLLATMQKMQANLRGLISQIQVSADSINNGAHEISSGNTNLSQRTEEQASSLEETASSMEQMAATVKQNAENAKQANAMANEASEVALKGRRSVAQVIFNMEEISSSSKKIVDIISVIDGIAFQTNILALNAAVEAARAGEQGRGFAVVAAEVRSLAQRSATAAKEIKQLINASVENVASGSKLVEVTAETMQEIVTAVKMVTDIVNEIAAASQEQSAGIDQVNNAITSMDEVTQQNAALVEQAAAAAVSLQDQAQELAEATSQFRLGTDQDYRAIDAKKNQSADLNSVLSAHTSVLPNKKDNGKRLKAPKANEHEDWEEF
jgi:methyl-accepting chemotaxis protein